MNRKRRSGEGEARRQLPDRPHDLDELEGHSALAGGRGWAWKHQSRRQFEGAAREKEIMIQQVMNKVVTHHLRRCS